MTATVPGTETVPVMSRLPRLTVAPFRPTDMLVIPPRPRLRRTPGAKLNDLRKRQPIHHTHLWSEYRARGRHKKALIVLCRQSSIALPV
jgi:hypothetical protein